MLPADDRLVVPAMFADIDLIARHSRQHLRPDSRDERLAIETSAYADVGARAAARTGWNPTTSLPRPQPARGAIWS